MQMNMQSSLLATVALFAVAIAGCGGGAGTTRVMDDPPMSTPEPTPTPMPEPTPTPMPEPTPTPMPIDDRGVSGGIPAAARNRPLAGESIVQSANGADGVTIDAIAVQVDFASAEHLRYRIASGDEWFLGSDDSGTETIDSRRDRRPASGLTVTGVLATKGQGHPTGDGSAHLDDGVALVFFTDIDNADDTDYLVWGAWVDARDDFTTHQDLVHGAFATGHDPFRQGDLAALTGVARYRGDVAGVYFDPAVEPVGGYSFDARVTLEASFGDSHALGTISGSIDNFRLQVDGEGTRQPSPRMTVTLEGTSIGGADSGYFEGTSTGSHHDGTPLSGRWGGRFYGNAESDGKPGSVAGTFGAAGADDDRGMIGAFGAHRQ